VGSHLYTCRIQHSLPGLVPGGTIHLAAGAPPIGAVCWYLRTGAIRSYHSSRSRLTRKSCSTRHSPTRPRGTLRHPDTMRSGCSNFLPSRHTMDPSGSTGCNRMNGPAICNRRGKRRSDCSSRHPSRRRSAGILRTRATGRSYRPVCHSSRQGNRWTRTCCSTSDSPTSAEIDSRRAGGGSCRDRRPVADSWATGVWLATEVAVVELAELDVTLWPVAENQVATARRSSSRRRSHYRKVKRERLTRGLCRKTPSSTHQLCAGPGSVIGSCMVGRCRQTRHARR
jgi:hypothetical protein